MTSRSGRGRWQRVLDARAVTRAEIGRGDAIEDRPPPKRRAVQELHRAPTPAYVPVGPIELVVTISDAAQRLGIDRDDFDAMAANGKVELLETGFTWMVPVREIERLSRARPIDP